MTSSSQKQDSGLRFRAGGERKEQTREDTSSASGHPYRHFPTVIHPTLALPTMQLSGLSPVAAPSHHPHLDMPLPTAWPFLTGEGV